MLQTIALASTRLACFAFENLTERFIRIVLEALSENLQLPIADKCLIDQARKHQVIEKLFYPELSRVSVPDTFFRPSGTDSQSEDVCGTPFSG